MIKYFFLISRQGKVRLTKWFTALPIKTKAKIIQEVTRLVLVRRPRMCNVIEYRGSKIIYRQYASLFFVCEIEEHDNELMTLELIHRYVEVLDRYFGNVCELDLIFNYQQAYAILDELVVAGEVCDSSRKSVLKSVHSADALEKEEVLTGALISGGFV